MPNRHTLIGMTVTVLMMGGALTAVAQGPRIYFGLPHTTVGNVHVSPSQDDTLMLELGDGSPAQNHLMIDPSNGEVMALLDWAWPWSFGRFIGRKLNPYWSDLGP